MLWWFQRLTRHTLIWGDPQSDMKHELSLNKLHDHCVSTGVASKMATNPFNFFPLSWPCGPLLLNFKRNYRIGELTHTHLNSSEESQFSWTC